MKITFVGTCSGTEPMPGRHHTSVALEVGSRLFWLDAGENCAYAGHLIGLDLPATEAIFISHTHVDHTGGLAHLIFTLNKLTKVSSRALETLSERTLRVFIPDLAVWNAAFKIAVSPKPKLDGPFQLQAETYNDGVIYLESGVKVIARHNRHISDSPPFQSFSFRIEADSKCIVYSGDAKAIDDIEGLLQGCDILIMETGHHKVEDVCHWLKISDRAPARLVFTHHGRAILENSARELDKARRLLGDIVTIAEDGMTIEI